MNEAARSIRLVASTAYRTAPLLTVSALALAPAAQMLAQLSGLWLKFLADAALRNDPDLMARSAGLLATSITLALLAGRFAFELRQTLSERVQAAVEARVMSVSASLPGIEHHERPEFRDKVQLLRNELGNLGGAMNFVPDAIGTIGRFVVSGVLLASIHPALLALPLFGIPPLIAATAAQRRLQRAQESTAESSRLQWHLLGLGTSAGPGKELRVFNLQDEIRLRHGDAWRTSFRAFRRAQWIGIGYGAASSVFPGAGFAAAIGFVAWRVTQGHGTPGEVLLAVTLAAQIQQELSNIRWSAMFLQGALRAARRYLWFVEYEQAVAAPHLATAVIPDRIEHSIELRNVSFRYPGTDAIVLDHVSLSLPAGAVIALVGENGAGKTTLAKLLCRFYEPTSGSIEVDGIDLRSFAHVAWRGAMSAAFQDFALFELVMREVVGVGHLPSVDDDASVLDALDRAAARELVDAFPSGLSMQLGKRWAGGVEVSVGQWQKLALGRALMRPAPLLQVFDEPTASLDAQTEHALFERFAASARDGSRHGTITVLVSHRFSTVRMADSIVVLDQGRVAERGTHDELMRSDGLYAGLYSLQARGYE